MRVRIDFIKAGKVIKSFDREAASQGAAEKLAAQIAADSGIIHDHRVVRRERRFKAALLDKDRRQIEIIESKAFDEADAKGVAARWSGATKKTYADLSVVFLEE